MEDNSNSCTTHPRRKRPVISCRECHRRKEKCDRRQPCGRCIRRGKRSDCVYSLSDTGTVIRSSDRAPPPMGDVLQSRSDTTIAPPLRTTEDDNLGSLGYVNNATGTQGIIHGLGESMTQLHDSRFRNSTAGGQYADILRDLPPRRHIAILVRDFFQNVAWQYDVVDESNFMDQLSQWNSLSYRQLQLAPDGLPIGLQSFPALLFQVLAQALLFQPLQHDKRLNDLKTTADMKLSDRAAEYSAAGNRMTLLFNKSELTLTIVQAELMRACFEKTSGAVVEAWHTLGVAIRDAQELGLHQIRPEHEHKQAWSMDSSGLDHAHQVWLMLHIWDAHMAAVLGRPMTTRVNADEFPVSTPWNNNSDTWPIKPRDVILCGYHTAYKFLQDIHDLERTADCRIHVEGIHASLLVNIANLPVWAHPDRLRQHEPPWLSIALETMYTNVYFVLFTLHRPFIFVESSSRARAFEAATQILGSQARLFNTTEPLQHKAFSLVFATFDAMVLVVALFIHYPDEFLDQLSPTKTTLEWALERLKLLRASNKLATAAFDVVQRLYRRLSAVAAPARSLDAHGAGTGSDVMAGLEVDMSDTQFDALFPMNDESMILPPHPLSQLLCEGPSDLNTVW